MPEIYSIFISRFDIFGLGETKYQVDKVIRGTNVVVNDGVHEIYVNAKVDDGSEIAELMKMFKSSDEWNPRFPKLSSRVVYFKKSKEGVSEMCKIVEDYAKEYAKEYAKGVAEARTREMVEEFLKSGVSVETIASAAKWTVQEVEKVQAELLMAQN